jgi:Predicted pyridoxal phosphate-dependent enzyme apparently involved in regulation of cell wall biogenesis
MTTSEGGMIVTRNRELARRLRHLRAFGVDRQHGERTVPGVYDVTALGFNYRMSEINAAMGIEQLKKVSRFLAQRRQNFESISEKISLLDGIRVLPQPCDSRITSSHYCLGVILESESSRPELMAGLTRVGVGSSVYYPAPVPDMSYYKAKYEQSPEDFTGAQFISDRILALPVGPHLGEQDAARVAEGFATVWQETR